jgi:16S rRNA (guanine966-N2)-methyltransferase
MFGPEGVEGLVVLDLYAGKGSFGLEALQRGAARLVMVEKNRRRCDDLKQALGNLSKDDQEPDATVVCADVLRDRLMWCLQTRLMRTIRLNW